MKDEHLFLLDMARNDFLSFCIYTDKFFEVAPHHIKIAETLTKFMNWEIKNLILTLPPRSWKSRIMQEYIAYLYWKKPETDILYTWHSLSLLQWFSRNIRSRMQSLEYQEIFDTKFKGDNKSINNWSLEWWWEFSIYWVGWWITWKGWDCILKGEKINTDKWLINIEEVVNNYKDYKILSYNHKTNETEYKRILKVRELKTKRAFGMTTNKWTKIKTTWDHRIYTMEQWYTQMERLSRENKVLIYRSWVLELWKSIFKKNFWSKKKSKRLNSFNSLFKEMFMRDKILTQMQKVQKKYSKDTLSYMWYLQNIYKKTKRYWVQRVLKNIQTTKPFNKVLQYRLQKWLSLKRVIMKIKSKLQTLILNKKLSKWILQSKKKSFKERLKQMLCMLKYWKFSSSSQKQKSIKQWFKKLNNSLSSLPYNSPSQERVQNIKPLKWEYTVYDIQVEDNENFFCNNILVHNCLIIDDPYSTREEAESETIRNKVSEWYWSTFLSRRQTDKSQQIIIMQRWREDDLVWEILEKEADKWEVIKIPALNEKWESFRPERFSPEYFQKIKNDWPLYFASQYQQEPVSAEWWDFKKEYFEYYDDVSDRTHLMDIYSFIDPAISERQEADFTAIITIWVLNNIVYILEVKHLKTTPDNIINEVFDTAMRYKSMWRAYRFWIEVVAYQKMLSLEITKQMRIRNQFFILNETRPTWEKNARIRTILQPRYSSHNIIHPKNNISDLELELLKFPKWKHDDLIDSLSWAISMSQVNVSNNKIYAPDYI